MLVEARFDSHPAGAAEVRQFVSEALEGARMDDVLLVVSELATIFLSRGDGTVDLRIDRKQGAVRFELGGGSQMIDALDELSDCGIRIVSSLADRWGIESSWHSTTFWAEFLPRPALVPR